MQCIDYSNGETRKLSINNASVVKHFYTVTADDGNPSDYWEQRLGDAESLAAPVLRRAIETPDWQPRGDDRACVALWLALQHLRTTAMRRSLSDFEAQLIKLQTGTAGIERLRKVIEQSEGRPVPDDELEMIWTDLTQPGGPVIRVPAEKHIATMTSLTTSAANSFMARGWHLIKFRRRKLATSDAPIVLVKDPIADDGEGIGFGTARALTVALDRNTLLFLSDYGDADFPVDPGTIFAKAHNFGVALNAERFAFHHPDDSPLPQRAPLRGGKLTNDGIGNQMIRREGLTFSSPRDPVEPRGEEIPHYTWPIPGYTPPTQSRSDGRTGEEGV